MTTKNALIARVSVSTGNVKMGKIPKNLHVLFSGWIGIPMENPYKLPEAHVIFKDGTTSARDGAKYCSGNCYECALTCGGCWSMKKGEQVLFREH